MHGVSSGHLLSIDNLRCPMILLADSEGPDQTAQMRSLIWVFAVCIWPKVGFHMGPAQLWKIMVLV